MESAEGTTTLPGQVGVVEGASPEPKPVESTVSTILERGSQKRQEISTRISGMREKVTKGIDFVLGSGPVLKERAPQIKESIMAAGEKAWEGIVDAKDRLVQRASEARDRLAERIGKIKGTTVGEKIVNLRKSAAVWGLTNVVSPFEDRLRAIYEIPARIRDWQASREDAKAQKQQDRIDRAK